MQKALGFLSSLGLAEEEEAKGRSEASPIAWVQGSLLYTRANALANSPERVFLLITLTRE